MINEQTLTEAYDAFRDAYAETFPRGGDEGDHDEATRAGVEAVLESVYRPLRQAAEKASRERDGSDGYHVLSEAVWDIVDPPKPKVAETERGYEVVALLGGSFDVCGPTGATIQRFHRADYVDGAVAASEARKLARKLNGGVGPRAA